MQLSWPGAAHGARQKTAQYLVRRVLQASMELGVRLDRRREMRTQLLHQCCVWGIRNFRIQTIGRNRYPAVFHRHNETAFGYLTISQERLASE